MIDIEKLKAAALDGDLLAVEVLIEQLEAAEKQCSLQAEASDSVLNKKQVQIIELERKLEASECDAAKWHEYQAKKKVLADRGFGKSPLRDAAMKGT